MNKEEFIFFDTNALIRLLDGDMAVKSILGDKKPCISVITEMEMQCKPHITASERALIKALLDELVIFELNDQIKNMAIKTRLSTSLKLMDSIIIATAQWINLPLVSSEVKFKSASKVNIVLLSDRE